MATRRQRRPRQSSRGGAITRTGSGGSTARARARRPSGPIVLSPPDLIGAQYAATLRELVATLYARVTSTVVAAYEREASKRADAQDPEAHPFVQVFGGIAVRLGAPFERDPEQLALPIGGKVEGRHRGQHDRQIGRVLGVDPLASEPWLDPVMRSWNASNVALIRTLPSRAQADIERAVIEAWTSGLSTRDMQKRLERAQGATKWQAERIARDQVGKLHGELSAVRQASVGVTEYVWRTSLDERVRQTHADLHGTTQSWDSAPAPDGHPGQGVMCRCGSDPVLDDLLTDDGLDALLDGDYAEKLHGQVDGAVRALGQWADPSEKSAIAATIPGVDAFAEAMAINAGITATIAPATVARVPRKPVRTPGKPSTSRPAAATQPDEPASWENATSVASARRSLRDRFNVSDGDPFEAGATSEVANALREVYDARSWGRQWGRRLSKMDELAMLNAVGAELARLERLGMLDGWMSSVHIVPRRLNSRTNGQVTINRFGGRYVMGIDPAATATWGRYTDPHTSYFRNMDGDTKLAHTLRHELAHTLEELVIAEWNDITLQYDRAWFSSNVSVYGSSSAAEALAETFAMYTAPGYTAGELPPDIEDVMELMLTKSGGKALGPSRPRRDVLAPSDGKFLAGPWSLPVSGELEGDDLVDEMPADLSGHLVERTDGGFEEPPA